MKAAEFWHSLDETRIQCDLCPHHCKLREGQTGLCMVRRANGGVLQAIAYGLISSVSIDPIEKKPLYHFLPGSRIFSVGGWGCNFACKFCQNWTISQDVTTDAGRCSPEQIIAKAMDSGAPSIAYTYNEPLVGFEFVYDCAVLAKKAGLANVLVTNGYIETEPAAKLLPLIRALNVDIKSMEDGFYKRQCRGRLDPVLRFSEQAVAAGCHVEITNLLIPTLNDRPEQIRELAEWIRDHLGKKTPLHISGYKPEYQMDIPATPPSLLENAWTICKAALPYVYVGNVLTRKGQDTNCPQCGVQLVKRLGYITEITGIGAGTCVKCGRKADVVQ